MVYGGEVKEFIFQSGTSATVQMSGAQTFYSQYAINGEILQVSYNTPATGSLFCAVSGTGEVFFTDVEASGTTWQIVRPVALAQLNNGTSFNAGSSYRPYVCNAPITIQGGTDRVSGAVQLRILYR